MNKLILILIFTILASCKDTDLNFSTSSMSKKGTAASLLKRSKEKLPRESGDEQGNSKTENLIECSKYCADITNFESIEKDNFSYLAFTNFAHRGIGRCRGHALLTQKLNFLATFKESDGCDLSEFECINHYRTGIYKIKAFKSFEFKGFKNLYEFSSNTKIASILRGIVAGTSNRYKAGKAKIKNRTYQSEILNHYYEVVRRVQEGQMPYVGVEGILTGAHGLLPYKESYIGSKPILCVKDPNVATGNPEDCTNYFYQEDGKVYYKRSIREADHMFKFSLTSDEDLRSKKYLRSLHRKCITDSRKFNICK